MIVLKENSELKNAELIEARVSEILRDIGVMPHLNGFTYMKSEIMILLSKSPTERKAILIYQQVGEKFNVKPASIERTVRYAINTAYTQHKKHIQEFMKIEDGHIPANFELICFIAEKVRSEMLTENLI